MYTPTKIRHSKFPSLCHCRYLLPPVIFYCGLSVEKSRFFVALPSILTFGVFGTLASFIIISTFMYLTLGFAMFKMEVGQLACVCVATGGGGGWPGSARGGWGGGGG